MVKIGIAYWNEKFSCYEMLVTPPGMNPFRVYVVEVKDKNKENAPDYTIFYSVANITSKIKSFKIGSLWNKVSEKGTNYLSGQMLIGQIECKIILFQNTENENYQYDLFIDGEVQRRASNSLHSAGSNIPNASNADVENNASETVSINEDEIPF